MMGLYAPMMVLIVLGIAGALGYFLGRGAGARQPGVDAATVQAVRRESAELRALLSRIKDTAWDQRELDPALSTIIIEEIRAYERRELE